MKKPIFKTSSKEFIFFLCFAIITIIVFTFTVEKFPFTFIKKEASTPKFEAVAQSDFLTHPDQAFLVDIVPQNPLSAFVYRLEILFDPQIISVEEVLAGSFFDHPQVLRRNIDNQKGTIDFSAGISIAEKEAMTELQNNHSLVTLKVKIKAQEQDRTPSKITFSFGEKTLIIGEEERFENSSLLMGPMILQSAL